MGASVPTWSLNNSVVSRQTLAVNNLVRGSLDLSTAVRAKLFVYCGRGQVTACANPIEIVVRALQGASVRRNPNNNRGRIGNTGTAVIPTLSASTSAGDTTFGVSSGTSIARGQVLCVGYNTANMEFIRVASISGITITPDSPLINAHTSGDTVSTYADVWEIQLPGGSVYDVVFDYCASATGPTLCIQAVADIYTQDTLS